MEKKLPKAPAVDASIPDANLYAEDIMFEPL